MPPISRDDAACERREFGAGAPAVVSHVDAALAARRELLEPLWEGFGPELAAAGAQCAITDT
ncbi:hypothetical protein OKW50_001528 [Paraburkholderia youngii]|uniref:hypothetical protein n=1 Tax=Paraburkholderia youngii TaxID=2782701 RepID=UPI003D25BA7B